MSAYLAVLDRLVGDGGEANFAVFEDPETGLYVQVAAARGAGTVLVDVPTGVQDVDADVGTRLEEEGFEATADTWFDVDRDRLERAGPEVTQEIHEWIAQGRSPDDDRVERLETHGLVERVEGPERATYQAVLPPERAAYVVDRVFRTALGAPDDHDVRVEMYLEGKGTDVEHVGG